MTAQRVLYVINGFNKGGAEIGLKTMLEHGFLTGCKVKVVAFHQGSAELHAAIAGLVGPENLIVVSLKRKLTLAALWAGFLTLRRTIRTFRPTTVVLSLRQANILGRLALLDHRAIHCIAFEHIAKLEAGRLTPLYAVLLWLLSTRVDEVWADCRVTLEGSRRYYLGRRPERVVPLFVAKSHVLPKADYALRGGVRLVTAGRLVARKRIDLLLTAIAHLRAEACDCTLTIYGDGPEREALTRLAAQLGLSEAVDFAGFRPDWHLAARDHDLCVHLSNQEGFCIVVAEAMMVGLPVVAYPVGGILEYSRHGSDAIHATTSDPAAVARLILDLLAREDRRRSLGEAAADRIAQSYGTASATAIYDALTRAVARPRAEPVSPSLMEERHGRV